MATRSLKRVFLACLLCVAIAGHSQVLLIPETQVSGVIIRKQLWSAVINNLSGSVKNTVLFVTITDRITSQVLLEATSNLIVLPPGIRRVSYNELAPLNYGVVTMGFSADRQFNQPLPVGEYLVCYRLFDNENKREVLVSECIKIAAEPLSPPLLIQPENKAVIMEPRPVLTWTPPAPVYMFNALSYDIIVSPLYDKQSPEEALQRNIPLMTTSSANNSIMYPSSYTNLEAGKTYAWQVVAKDAGRLGGKSEVWTFSVMPDSVAAIITGTPYISLTREQAKVTVLHQGVFKAEYFNALADTTVIFELQKLTNNPVKGRQATRFELPVKAGQNFLEYNLNGKVRLDEISVYEVKLINSAREEWIMRFVPKYYF